MSRRFPVLKIIAIRDNRDEPGYHRAKQTGLTVTKPLKPVGSGSRWSPGEVHVCARIARCRLS